MELASQQELTCRRKQRFQHSRLVFTHEIRRFVVRVPFPGILVIPKGAVLNGLPPFLHAFPKSLNLIEKVLHLLLCPGCPPGPAARQGGLDLIEKTLPIGHRGINAQAHQEVDELLS